MVGGILNVILNLSLDVLLGSWLGVPGIALASSIAQGVVMLLFLVRLRTPDGVQVRPLMRTLRARGSFKRTHFHRDRCLGVGWVGAGQHFVRRRCSSACWDFLVCSATSSLQRLQVWRNLARSPCSSGGASFDESRLPKGTDPDDASRKPVQRLSALGVRDAGAVDDVGELPGRERLDVAGDRQRRDVLEVHHVARAGGGRPVVREPDVGAVRAVGSSGDAAGGVSGS